VTGDITRHGLELESAVTALRSLAGLAALAVLGNHDLRAGEARASALSEAITVAGVMVLRDRSVVVSVRGEPVRIIGLDAARTPGKLPLRSVLAGLSDRSTPRIVLTHSPSALRDLHAGDALLALAGHTHGGQVFVPIVTCLHHRGAFLGLGDGLGWRRGVHVHTSRGLATAKLPLRFLRRPEVTVLTLRRGPEGARE
jgi:hypothetical protein